ncbi:MAG: cold-shock protein [Chloroflexi bacterium]|nr:cold-shock protein [Chloroflexota bacterium]
MPENRQVGKVKWFNPAKGFGFIQPEDSSEGAEGKDIFVHYSAIRGSGYRNLAEGERVEYTIEQTPKGPQALDVVKLPAE